MNNSDLKHAEERNQLIALMAGYINLGGIVRIDNDDNEGHFTLTQEWTFGGEKKKRTLHCKLTVNKVEEEECKEN